MPADLARRLGPVPAPVRGVLWMMGSTASWAVMAVTIRFVGDEIHPFEIVFLRSLFGMAFLLPWLYRSGIKALHTRRLGMHFARAFFGLVAAYLIFTAITLESLGSIAAIMTTRPIFASAAAILILHEVSHGRRWSAAILGFVGALIILRPGMVEVSTGALLAFIGVFSMVAVALIMKSLARTERPDAMATWQMIVFVPASLIPALFVWTTPSWEAVAVLVAMGCAGTLTQRALARAYHAADATVVLPFEFTRLIFSAAIGFVVFAEFPDIWVWVGGGVILAGIMTMAGLEAKRAPARG